MKYPHLMIDIETLGKRPTSVITQIGLCSFSIDDEKMESRLIRVDPESCVKEFMTVDWSTIKFWLKESEAARNELTREDTVDWPIDEAMRELIGYVVRHHASPFCVWANSPSFDIVILEDAFDRFSLAKPWSFRSLRDVRTLAAIAPKVDRPQPEIKHQAVSDAIAQAKWVREMHHAFNDAVYSKS